MHNSHRDRGDFPSRPWLCKRKRAVGRWEDGSPRLVIIPLDHFTEFMRRKQNLIIPRSTLDVRNLSAGVHRPFGVYHVSIMRTQPCTWRCDQIAADTRGQNAVIGCDSGEVMI